MDRALGIQWNIDEDKLEFEEGKALHNYFHLRFTWTSKSISAKGKENTLEFVL